MSSINPYYTFQYSQPDEYHFSHDSVFLARQVFELEGHRCQEMEVLDLCAGCGIVGLDFLFHCRKEYGEVPRRMDFVEVQEIYKEHFARNATASSSTNIRFMNRNYSQLLSGSDRYDLILCNPPYFERNTGKLSPSQFKNRCRFFLDSDFSTLIGAIQASLKPRGRAYVLARLIEARWPAGFHKIGEIRGTPLLRIDG